MTAGGYSIQQFQERSETEEVEEAVRHHFGSGDGTSTRLDAWGQARGRQGFMGWGHYRKHIHVRQLFITDEGTKG
jgi:hypothetical protein